MSTSAHADIIDVDNASLAELLEQGVPIIDVRLPIEWQETGVIEGSHLLTFFQQDGSVDAEAWKHSLDTIADAGEPVILICRSGSRSSKIADWLSNQLGHTTVYNVKEGIMSWRQSGGTTIAP